MPTGQKPLVWYTLPTLSCRNAFQRLRYAAQKLGSKHVKFLCVFFDKNAINMDSNNGIGEKYQQRRFSSGGCPSDSNQVRHLGGCYRLDNDYSKHPLLAYT